MKAAEFDICFFVKGIPPKLVLSSRRWTFAAVRGSGLAIATALAESNARFRFFMGDNNESLRAFVYRGEGDELKSSIRDAYSQLELILDAYSLMTNNPVEVAKTIITRGLGNRDAEFFEYYKDGSRFIERIDAEGQSQWHARNYALFQTLDKYLSFASSPITSETSDVEQNLRFALRMYRQGFEANFAGLSFLAKFSALECLVCGAKKIEKERWLVDRLGKLFDDLPIAAPDEVKKLWRLRCDGSHQAKLSLGTSSNHVPAEIASMYIDQLFAGVIYFLCDKLDCGKSTLDEIWEDAEEYALPEIITLHRPSNMGQLVVTEALVGPKGTIPGAGELFERIHTALNKSL